MSLAVPGVVRTSAASPAVRGWALAVLVYFLAVFHRSSLGVAGLLAEQRFGITAGQLSVFVLLQVAVYAAMQIPTGVLVDRYGPRRLLVGASALMGLGQLLFAVAPAYPTALLARGLLGCGDAMTFISVLRFAAGRFSARRYPLLVALTSMIGTLGNVVATLPLSMVLGKLGWTAGFAGAASLSLLAAGAVWLLLDDRAVAPRRLRSVAELRQGISAVGRRVAASWGLPGTRLGFWVHFSCMSVATTFGMLWGQPYLIEGAGFSASSAGTVLMIGVFAAGVVGPLVGWLIGRRPAVRVSLALAACTVSVLGWLVVVTALGNHPVKPFVAVLFVITMLGGPASMVAFAVARDYNHVRIVGTASGAVNVGGFLATALVAVGFGWTLTLLGGTSSDHMRYALLVPVAVQLAGTVRIVVWHRRVRAAVLRRQHAGQPVPVRVARRYWWDLEVDAPAGTTEQGTVTGVAAPARR